MCKKLVLAALAIIVGTAIVRHTQFGSLAQVWWKEAKHSVERQVPPEVQIKQLEVEINKIDKDIKRNLSALAAQEVDTQALEENVAALKDSQTALRAELAAMTKALDGKAERVSFNNKNYRASDLARRLDNALERFEAKKGELKSKEQLLASKKQTLEAAHARISEMRDQKETLRVTVGKLEARMQLARLNATRTNVDLDDSQVTRCKQLADEINKRLALEEKEQELQAAYGYATPAPKADKEAKPTADVLKAAKKALEDDEATKVAASDEK